MFSILFLHKETNIFVVGGVYILSTTLVDVGKGGGGELEARGARRVSCKYHNIQAVHAFHFTTNREGLREKKGVREERLAHIEYLSANLCGHVISNYPSKMQFIYLRQPLPKNYVGHRGQHESCATTH